MTLVLALSFVDDVLFLVLSVVNTCHDVMFILYINVCAKLGLCSALLLLQPRKLTSIPVDGPSTV